MRMKLKVPKKLTPGQAARFRTLVPGFRRMLNTMIPPCCWQGPLGQQEKTKTTTQWKRGEFGQQGSDTSSTYLARTWWLSWCAPGNGSQHHVAIDAVAAARVVREARARSVALAQIDLRLLVRCFVRAPAGIPLYDGDGVGPGFAEVVAKAVGLVYAVV